jgi:hypothetical protein
MNTIFIFIAFDGDPSCITNHMSMSITLLQGTSSSQTSDFPSPPFWAFVMLIKPLQRNFDGLFLTSP